MSELRRRPRRGTFFYGGRRSFFISSDSNLTNLCWSSWIVANGILALQEIVPSNFRIVQSFTIALPKTCNPNALTDLRPISEFVNRNSLLPLVESGFMAGHDCGTVLLKVIRTTLPHLRINDRERFWLYWALLKNSRLFTIIIIMVWLEFSMPILNNFPAAFLVILDRTLNVF